MQSAKTDVRAHESHLIALVLFCLVVFAVIALRTPSVASFSLRGSAVASLFIVASLVVADRLRKFKKNPQLIQWMLLMRCPLALALSFPHLATVMLAVTLALLKGLVAYFFATRQMEGMGRQRLLCELGLLPLDARYGVAEKKNIFLSALLLLVPATAFLFPSAGGPAALLLWFALAGFIAVDLSPQQLVGVRNGR